MRVLEFFWICFFPPKCILCSRLLQHQETDLCKTCRLEAPTCSGRKKSISFVMDWTAVYYYEGTVRESLLRYKFGGRQHYAAAYGRLLAARISEELHGEFDLLTYVPVSTRRRLRRALRPGSSSGQGSGAGAGNCPGSGAAEGAAQCRAVFPPGPGATARQRAGRLPGRQAGALGWQEGFIVR